MLSTFYKYIPLLCFIGVWILIFFLQSLGLYNLKSVSNSTIHILLTGIFSLTFGYVLTQLYSPTSWASCKLVSVSITNEKLLLQLVLVLSFLQLFGSLIIFSEVAKGIGGYSVYFNRPILVRQFIVGIQRGYEEVGPLYRIGNYISNSGFISILLGGILFASKSKYRVFGLLAIISLIVTQLVSVGRYRFITGLIFFIVSYTYFCYFFDNKLRNRRIIELFFMLLISSISITLLSYIVLKFRSPLELDLLGLLKKSLYYYVTGGVVAFDNFLSTDFKFLYGESSFRSIFKWLARIGIWAESDVINVHNSFTKVSPTYSMNTYTFLKSLYQDFGIVGCLFIPFIWGVITYNTVHKVLTNFSILSLFWLCLFTFSLVITFFSFYFQSSTLIVYWLINVFLINHFFNKRIFSKTKIES